MTTNNLINIARSIPTPEAALTVAYSPIRLDILGRQPLELRLTAPAVGTRLPIIILSHAVRPQEVIQISTSWRMRPSTSAMSNSLAGPYGPISGFSDEIRRSACRIPKVE